MRIRRRGVAELLVLTLPLVLAGCVSLDKPYPEQRLFRLDAGPGELAERALEPGMTLCVSRFTASPSFRTLQFVYRMSDNRWLTDYSNAFFMQPESLLAEETARRMSESQLFRHVTAPGEALPPALMLQGHVVAIYADLRDKASCKAVLKMHFFLVDVRREPKVVFDRQYDMEIPIDLASAAQETRGETIVGGWNQCLIRILSALQADLTQLTLMPAD
jgi:hypothetical protein